jgi:hypothetical protein
LELEFLALQKIFLITTVISQIDIASGGIKMKQKIVAK